MSGDSLREIGTRDQFSYFLSIPTRWKDNDVYGHVNNVVYYSYFDTLITQYLIVECRIDIVGGPVVPFTVENMCRYRRSFSFPEVIDAGLRVARLGNSSVRYEIGLFGQGQQDASAVGYFVDVFVDRGTGKSVRIPQEIHAVLERLVV